MNRSYEFLLLTIFAFLNFADISITQLGLTLFPMQLYEADPFTASLIGSVGIAFTFMIKALIVMLFVGIFVLMSYTTSKIKYESIRTWLNIGRLGLIGAFSLTSAVIVYNNIVVVVGCML